MFDNTKFCNICNKELEKYTHSHDPVFNVYKCHDCGYYVLLDEIYDYINDAKRPNVSKERLDDFKSKKNVNFENTCIVIGGRLDIERCKKQNFDKCLQTGRFGFKNIIYLDNDGETNE